MKKTTALISALLLYSLQVYSDIPRFKEVAPHFYRGGQPTEELDFRELKAMGIRTIINLRETQAEIDKEQRVAKKVGIRYFSIPTSAVVPPPKTDIKRALQIIDKPEYQPVFLHCRHGEDRTGITAGLYRVYFDKWSAERAYEEMVDNGFKQYLLGLSGFFWTYGKSGTLLD